MKTYWPVPLLLVAVAALALIDGETGVRAWWRLRSDLAAAQARIQALRVEVARLEDSVEALESDPLALERAIREELEFARSGEWVVRLPRVHPPAIPAARPRTDSSRPEEGPAP